MDLMAGYKVKVYWSEDDAWYTGTVGDTGSDGLTHIAYEDGDEEDLDMSKEKYEGAALGDKTVGNYRPKARAFMAFCEEEGREWLPATRAMVRLRIAHMLSKGTVLANNMQPYLSAINNYHEDMGFPGPAKSRAVSRAVKGMSRLQMVVLTLQMAMLMLMLMPMPTDGDEKDGATNADDAGDITDANADGGGDDDAGTDTMIGGATIAVLRVGRGSRVLVWGGALGLARVPGPELKP
eukprot:gene3827-biopygen3771